MGDWNAIRAVAGVVAGLAPSGPWELRLAVACTVRNRAGLMAGGGRMGARGLAQACRELQLSVPLPEAGADLGLESPAARLALAAPLRGGAGRRPGRTLRASG